MKLLLGSDLHLEFRNQGKLPELPDYDVAVLAGDIALGEAGAFWASRFFDPNKPVLYVPGNHEYYHHNVDILNGSFGAADYGQVKVLNPGTVEIDDYLFVGATLRSALHLEGYTKYAFKAYENAISDFSVCNTNSGKWTALEHVSQHLNEVAYINQIADQNNRLLEHRKKLIVVTHFLPVKQCIAPRYTGSNINPYFCNDLDWLLEEQKIDAWLYGHTHDSYEGYHPTGTHLVCNPRGYPNEKSKQFEWKVIEL